MTAAYEAFCAKCRKRTPHEKVDGVTLKCKECGTEKDSPT
jgi:hypothetical protein